MIKDLARLATKLDKMGLTKEADVLDVALRKLAQVATTGVEGATYSGGRQMTPGFPGGPTVKFYRSKPKSISELNAFLGALIRNAAADPRQTSFSPAVINNLPSKSDTTWGPKTQAAFKEYAAAAGFPDAGENWADFAKKSGMYEPTLNGIYRFWEDTVARVDSDVALTKLLEEQSRQLADANARPRRLEDYGKGMTAPSRGTSYDPMNPLAGLDLPSDESASAAGAAGGEKAGLGNLRARLYNNISGGTGFQIGSEEGRVFSTLTGQIMRKIDAAMASDEEARKWFSQRPDMILPDSAIESKNFTNVYTGNNPEIKEIYLMIQETLQDRPAPRRPSSYAG